MKRKAHYNVGKGAGGGKYTNNIPDRKRNARLRPVNNTKTGSLFNDAIFGILICALGIALMRLIL